VVQQKTIKANFTSNLFFFFELLLTLKIFDNSLTSLQTKIRMGNKPQKNSTFAGNEVPPTNLTSANNKASPTNFTSTINEIFSMDLSSVINEIHPNVWNHIVPELQERPTFTHPYELPMELLMYYNKFLFICTLSLETISPGTRNLTTSFPGEESMTLESILKPVKECRYHARPLDINSSSLPRYAVLTKENILQLLQTNITFPSVEFLVISGSILSTSIEKVSNLFPNLIYLVIIPGLELEGTCDFRKFSKLKVLYISNLDSSHPKNKHSISVGPLKELYINESYLNFSIDGAQLTEGFTKL
jgi:hypothetical protein